MYKMLTDLERNTEYPEGYGPPHDPWFRTSRGELVLCRHLPDAVPFVRGYRYLSVILEDKVLTVVTRSWREDDDGDPCGPDIEMLVDCILPEGHDCPHLAQPKEDRYHYGPLYVERISIGPLTAPYSPA